MSKLGVPGHIYPKIKGQWLNLRVFFDFRGGEIYYVFVDLLTELPKLVFWMSERRPMQDFRKETGTSAVLDYDIFRICCSGICCELFGIPNFDL